MLVTINSAVTQTIIFAVIFFSAFLLLWRQRKDLSFFPVKISAELKGLAILMIIFGHVGYFLATDHAFLYPLSVAMGVGVDLFLFLSGFGLAVSALKKQLPITKFYLRRFSRLYLPLWIMMLIFIPLDIFVLHRQYDSASILQIALGWVKQADLYNNFNSPLWFLTLIVFYYLLFPFVFWRKAPELSAVVFWLAGFLILKFDPIIIKDVRRLYELHYVAFPLGVLFAGVISRIPEAQAGVKNWLENNERAVMSGRLVLMAILLYGALYFSLHSGVGAEKYIAHTLSLLTSGLYIAVFLIKKTEWKLLTLFGMYSYEIYLLHWPLAYRYDLLFKYLPAGVAMALYLAILLGLAYLINRGVEKFSKYMGF